MRARGNFFPRLAPERREAPVDYRPRCRTPARKAACAPIALPSTSAYPPREAA